MKLIDTGIVLSYQKVYIQSTGDAALDLWNRNVALEELGLQHQRAVRDGLHRPSGPLEYLEVPEPEPAEEVDGGKGEETISQRLARAFSPYAEMGYRNVTDTRDFLEVMAAAIAELDARTCRKVSRGRQADDPAIGPGRTWVDGENVRSYFP